MARDEIAKTLKKHRELAGLTVNDVIESLKLKGVEISAKTLYSWESGHRQPDADNLLFLCDIYHINNVLSAFGYEEESKTENSLTLDEKELLTQYRKLPDTLKEDIRDYVAMKYTKATTAASQQVKLA